jgi:hypothetical protein
MLHHIRERERLYRAALLEPSPEYVAASFRLRSRSPDVSVSSALEERVAGSDRSHTATSGANGCENQPHVIPSGST